MPSNTFTKILATIGPASASKQVLSDLIDAGADAFRFNFSHGSYEEHKQRLLEVRRLSEQKNRYITIVADMQGPKLRVGNFAQDKVTLKAGSYFTLDMDETPGDETRVCLPHPEIFKALKVGDNLLLNDGQITLIVEKCDEKSALTKVKFGGVLSGHKGVNLPNTKLNISSLTPKDLRDLDFALELGVDWISLSFVQTADDVKRAREIIKDRALIISNLEKPGAIEELEEIVKLSDGIMVARGDLGVECPIEQVPVMQKKIIECCRKYAKPVIVATQMLESMINSPSPTRAEVSDIATAVYDGADTVMLSAETAVGAYPVQAVSMMHKTISEVEKDKDFAAYMNNSHVHNRYYSEADAITVAAGELVNILENVACLVSYSMTGHTTFLTARGRRGLPIIAICPNITVARRLGICWGVKSFVDEKVFADFSVESTSIKIAKENNLAKKDDYLVIIAGYPFGKAGNTNLLHTVKVS